MNNYNTITLMWTLYYNVSHIGLVIQSIQYELDSFIYIINKKCIEHSIEESQTYIVDKKYKTAFKIKLFLSLPKI